MSICLATQDSENELLVGTDDFVIRIFLYDEVIAETVETDRVIDICPIQGTHYGYALANGTVGIYEADHRVWRVKSKSNVLSIVGCVISSSLSSSHTHPVANLSRLGSIWMVTACPR